MVMDCLWRVLDSLVFVMFYPQHHGCISPPPSSGLRMSGWVDTCSPLNKVIVTHCLSWVYQCSLSRLSPGEATGDVGIGTSCSVETEGNETLQLFATVLQHPKWANPPFYCTNHSSGEGSALFDSKYGVCFFELVVCEPLSEQRRNRRVLSKGKPGHVRCQKLGWLTIHPFQNTNKLLKLWILPYVAEVF